ncbi:hypothetical protein CLV86_0112 [Lacinutrix venerupis]|uniref:hypothetical protein n=1 Tax=Lacinutrix venerupis TaxID=1486034 RepID=UPI000EB0F6BB|nr:hypothetical protein [Lacinutrix venerupis]RLJ68723.1 hypothetical protein CLV86_0112 [Lacinutrix venerupis]
MKNLFTLVLGLIIGALIMYFFCCKTENLGAVEITKPRGVITPSEAAILDEQYNSRHTLISDSIVDRSDNRSSWWSLEDIRNYLDYAENQSRELGYTMDGLRVYLGAYKTENGVVGYTTMFMVPTSSEIEQDSIKGGSARRAGNGGDIPGGDPLNMGQNGTPPGGNYPQ